MHNQTSAWHVDRPRGNFPIPARTASGISTVARTIALFTTLASLAALPDRALAAPEFARKADEAVDIMGVNTHVWNDNWNSRIKPALLEVGIRHVRDWAEEQQAARYEDMARNGVDFLLINFKAADINACKALNAEEPKPVLMVEPTNEVDCNRANWAVSMREEQMSLFQRYKADPAAKDILVAGPSFCNSKDSPAIFAAAFPNARSYMDVSNLHNYTGGNAIEGPLGGGWGISFEETAQRYERVSGDRTLVSSETGYHNSILGGPPGHAGVSERAAAKYLPRLFLTHLRGGFRYAYLYEFYNQGTNAHEMEENFGLLRNDYSRKQQFISLKNYARILSDRGKSFTPGALDYSLSGNLAGVQHLLFQKQDGRFYLVLWQAVDSYDVKAKKDLEPAPRTLTVTIKGTVTSAKVYRPLESDLPVQTLSGSVLSLQVPDHIVIVELSGDLGSVLGADVRLRRPAARPAMLTLEAMKGRLWRVDGARAGFGGNRGPAHGAYLLGSETKRGVLRDGSSIITLF